MAAEATGRYVRSRSERSEVDVTDPGADVSARLARFAELVDGDAAAVPVDAAALALAAVLRPATDADGAMSGLDRLATACPDRTFEGLRRYLFDDVGFHGDREHYDDPQNSFLDLVLARRTGLPILLATVMMEVGRRAGVTVVGIGMPMHFLVRAGDDPDRFADPFGGHALGPDDARRMLETLSQGRLRWDDRYLEPVEPRAIVTRMLANLFAGYRRRGDPVRLALVAKMRAAIPELRAEATAAARLGAIFN
jgi:regulator of sirC expression with transglutaminase-like and TPR domain